MEYLLTLVAADDRSGPVFQQRPCFWAWVSPQQVKPNPHGRSEPGWSTVAHVITPVEYVSSFALSRMFLDPRSVSPPRIPPHMIATRLQPRADRCLHSPFALLGIRYVTMP